MTEAGLMSLLLASSVAAAAGSQRMSCVACTTLNVARKMITNITNCNTCAQTTLVLVHSWQGWHAHLVLQGRVEVVLAGQLKDLAGAQPQVHQHGLVRLLRMRVPARQKHGKNILQLIYTYIYIYMGGGGGGE